MERDRLPLAADHLAGKGVLQVEVDPVAFVDLDPATVSAIADPKSFLAGVSSALTGRHGTCDEWLALLNKERDAVSRPEGDEILGLGGVFDRLASSLHADDIVVVSLSMSPDAPAPVRGSRAHLVRGDVHVEVERAVSCPSISLDDVVERLRFLDDTHPDLAEGVFVLPDTGRQQGIRHGH
jgi:hypothetical protein